MTKEQAKKFANCLKNNYTIDFNDMADFCDMVIKALDQDNEEIFKQFKRKAFYESEDILGTDMVDTYMITDYLAELLGVENGTR